MKLNEKIYFYRKQAGLSQEGLAEQVGVSRQAVSKWELGEATPEVEKLLALAKAFGVTTDELLSQEEPAEKEPEPAPVERQADQYLGFIGRLIRRFGWLAGVYIAVGGLGITAIGGVARFAFGQMAKTAQNVMGGGNWLGVGNGVFGSVGFGGVEQTISTISSVPMTIATAILVIGICVLVAGIVLALWLYHQGRKNS